MAAGQKVVKNRDRQTNNGMAEMKSPMTTVKGVIGCGFGLTLVLWGVLKFI